MNKASNGIITASILGVLAFAGTIMSSHRAAAQGPENGLAVRIVHPVPVPVTGSLGISGTPTATLGAPLPLPVTQTAKQPVQVEAGGAISGPANFVLYVVPIGKRLVLEHFSSETAVAAGITVNRYILGIAPDPNSPGVSTFSEFVAPAFSSPCGTCAPGQVEVVASQPIRMYVDAGKALVVNVTFSGAVGPGAFFFGSASGRLIDAI